MSSHLSPRLLGGAVLVGALAVAFVVPAEASTSHVTATGRAATGTVRPAQSPGDSDCVQFDQSANQTGIGIISQNFESTLDAYDSQAADDFSIKSNCKGSGRLSGAKAIQVSNVTAFGIYFNGSGPADSFNVTFYNDKKGKPGSVVKKCANQPYTMNGNGGFQVDLSKEDNPKATCVKKDLKLQPKKTYWVSVQANLDFTAGGEWGWNTVSSTTGHAAMWQNPGDGFGSGCTAYKALTSCIDSGEGPDLAFQILR